MKTSNENSVITKKDLKKMFWRSLPMEFSWHYERQMHMGFCTMISDGLRKIYKNNPEGLKKALQRHLEFFNITPHVSTFVGGITLAMEEMNANQEDFDESSINAVKAALMGPLSGIGDSLLLGTLRVLAVGIGTPLAIGSGDSATKIQSILDGIMPGMLALGVTGLYYKLLGKNVNVMWIIIGTAILGIICAQFGILA